MTQGYPSPKPDARRSLALAVLALALCAWLLGGVGLASPPYPLLLHMIDVGQGDALLLSLPGGEHVLVDGGPSAAGPTVVAYLQQQGVPGLELIVATHAHADHIGGLPAVIEAFPVGAVWADSWDCATQTCARFYQSIQARGIPTDTARAGHAFRWGEVQGLVVHPGEPLASHPNNRSVVLRVTHGSVSVLLTGDAEGPAELEMLARGLPLEAQILKVAHHGSDSSSTAPFLAAVGPAHALISVGAANPYGHPRQAVLERLTAAGAEIWRTDLEGTIIVSTDGRTYRLQASSGRSAPILGYRVLLPLVRHSPPPAPAPGAHVPFPSDEAPAPAPQAVEP